MTMTNKLGKTLATGLLSLVAGCGRQSEDSIWTTGKIAAQVYQVENRSGNTPASMILFDVEGDDSIDQVLEIHGIENRMGIGGIPGLSKEFASYFVAAGVQPSQYLISGIEPQPLTPEYRELAKNFLKPLQNK